MRAWILALVHTIWTLNGLQGRMLDGAVGSDLNRWLAAQAR
jgi:hypothetical protein